MFEDLRVVVFTSVFCCSHCSFSCCRADVIPFSMFLVFAIRFVMDKVAPMFRVYFFFDIEVFQQLGPALNDSYSLVT